MPPDCWRPIGTRYEAVELNLYLDYDYLTEVWGYHEGIAEAIERGEVDHALALHEEHLLLLRTRNVPRSDVRQATNTEVIENARSQA